MSWFPASLDQRDPEAARWEAEYAEQYTWVKAIRNYRRANTLLNRVKSLWDGRNGDVFPFELLYFGADTTGRWSGGGVVMRRRFSKGGEEKGGKFNIQNMPRAEMFGVDLRHCFKAPEGKAFHIVDYSQIECRLLLWRAGDTKTLNMIKEGMHPYKAYAIANLGADKDIQGTDRKYMTAKACVLGCGYQAGAGAFQRAAKDMANLDITLDEARDMVRAYRAANPKVVKFWADHQRNLAYSANANDSTHEVQLASDRWMKYFNPHLDGADDYGRPRYKVQYTIGAAPESIYGGLLTENEIQATARDILRDAWVALDKKGFDVPATVHDEFIAIGPVNDKEYERELQNVVLNSSPWAEGCPLGVKAVVTEHYEK
jgi:DNA polymerase